MTPVCNMCGKTAKQVIAIATNKEFSICYECATEAKKKMEDMIKTKQLEDT